MENSFESCTFMLHYPEVFKSCHSRCHNMLSRSAGSLFYHSIPLSVSYGGNMMGYNGRLSNLGKKGKSLCCICNFSGWKLETFPDAMSTAVGGNWRVSGWTVVDNWCCKGYFFLN